MLSKISFSAARRLLSFLISASSFSRFTFSLLLNQEKAAVLDGAMKMLKAKLAQKQKDEQNAKIASVEKKKIEWGSQIRSYVLHPYKMVKDHRTDIESPQPDMVLDGDIMEFIEAYLIWASNPS